MKEIESLPDDSILFIFEGRDIPKRLEELLSKYPSDLVIIDTWGDLVGGKYDAEFTRKTMTEIKEVCTKYDSTPLYVHHTNKASENIPEKASIKGAGDFEQACRVVMMLSIYKETRWLCCVKGNPFPDDHKNTCYELGFNYETQTVFSTGRTESRHEIIRILRSENLGRTATEIDWLSLLDSEKYNYTNLVAMMVKTGISEPTAKRRIKSALKDGDIKKDENGLYRV